MALSEHGVSAAYELGWARLGNGELLYAAERCGSQVFVSTDKNLGYQQDLRGRRVAMVVLTTTSWPRIRREISAVVRAVDGAGRGSYAEVEFSHTG